MLGSGHDARKVIAFRIPLDYDEERIYSAFKVAGNIMEMEVPRDYDMPAELEEGEMIYRQIMGMEPIDLSYVNMTGLAEPNIFTDFRRYVLREIQCLQELILFQGNNSKQIFDELIKLFLKIRTFKDLLGVKPSVLEAEIESGINELIGKKSVSALKDSLSKIIKQTEADFNQVINKFFNIQGFARLTFATRNQAERAIAISNFLVTKEGLMQVHFDRNFPGYYYSTRLFAEAYTRENTRVLYRIKSEKKMQLKLRHHIDKFKTKFLVSLSKKEEYVGKDEGGDPIINQRARTEEESKEVIAGAQAIDDYGGKRRELFFRKHPLGPNRELISSTDDLLEIDTKEDSSLPTRGRLYDKNFDYTKQLMEKYILHPKEMPLTQEDVKSLMIVPDVEFPREIPPTKLYCSMREKLVAKQKLMTYQEFFHESIPEQVEVNPSLLNKGRYGDFPSERYTYEPPYDYLKLSSDNKEKNRRKHYMNELRSRIKGLLEKDEKDFDGKMMELGQEETELIENIDNIRAATDSEEENEIIAGSQDPKFAEGIKKMKRNKVKELKFLKRVGPILGTKSDISYSTKFKFNGQDVDSYVRQLNEVRGFNAVHSKNPFGEDIVSVGYTHSFKVKLEDVELFCSKYLNDALAANNEIEVDEEDAERIQKMLDTNISSQDLFMELVSQYSEREYKKSVDKSTSTEYIEKYGQFANMFEKHDKKFKKTNIFVRR